MANNEYEYRVGYKCGECGECYFLRDGLSTLNPPRRFSQEEAEKRARSSQAKALLNPNDYDDRWFWEPVNDGHGRRQFVIPPS